MNATRRAALVIASAALVLLPACSRKKTPAPDASTSAAKALRRVPKSARELPTTDADIYLENLDGQIAELTRLTGERPADVSLLQKLSASHHLRGRFRGDSDEIQLGIDGVTGCLRVEPENASCYLTRAEQEQSLHRFKESRADLERAKKLGAEPTRITDLETELDWNDALYEKAIPAIRKARRERPSLATWMREAQLEHDLGLEDEADAAFEAAEDLITDTAPLPVAHLNLQRGIQKSQQGRLSDACVFFREAMARMPTYVAANEHLAEALHALGKNDEATAIYEKVVAQSQDPEFKHALAELYAAKGKQQEARELQAKAHADYDVLLAKYPEAMYWHASEFHLATGDTKRALELLEKNVALRPNSVSFVALARAQLANGNAPEARKSIDKALAMPVRSALLFWTASRIYRSAGDVASADGFRDRAKRMNARIEAED